MRMKDAMKIMSEETLGYMVHFERVERGMLCGDCFPDKHWGEPLIKTEDEAWILAKRFAEKTQGRCVNIYVIDSKFHPVADYKKREIRNR